MLLPLDRPRQALSPYFQSWCCDKLTGSVTATYVSMLSIFSTETLQVFSTLWWHHKGSWRSSRTTKDIPELYSVVLNDRWTHSLCNNLRCCLWSCLNVDDNITNKVLHFVLDWTGPMVLWPKDEARIIWMVPYSILQRCLKLVPCWFSKTALLHQHIIHSWIWQRQYHLKNNE